MVVGRGTKAGVAGAVLAILLPTMSACGNDSPAGGGAGGGKVQLSLVAYSTPQEAYGKIIKAFQGTAAGKNVTFKQSYGASGSQSRAVESGLKADVVAFSLEPDVTRLVKDGLVAPDWNANATKGMVTDSVAVIATRKGNPKNIRTWDDLIKPGIQVITPNPITSGGARWNVLAGYGAKSGNGANRQAGLAYLDALFHHVPVQDDSARASLQTFSSGKGDAIISYENEAIFAQHHNQPLDYTVPDSTILIENPVAVTKNSAHPAEARAFLAFLHSPTAQKIFVDEGYRPTTKGVPGADRFPTPAHLFTIQNLGGWTSVSKEFFDPASGAVAAIERKLGVKTK